MYGINYMVVHDTLAITAYKKPNYANHCIISPGVVGPVGDVLMQTRLRQSTPGMPMRYDYLGGKGREPRMGANITDGMKRGFTDGGGLARVYDTNWQSGRQFKTQRGWIYQDLRKPDKRIEPYLGASGPQYDWSNKLATTYRSFHTGDRFLPAPGEYALSPGEIPRNGNTPGFYIEGDVVSLNQNRGVVTPLGTVLNPDAAGTRAQPMAGEMWGTAGWGVPN